MSADSVSVVKRCGDCRHSYDGHDGVDADTDPVLRCGCDVPFWVPLRVADYYSWVHEDAGGNCHAFEAKAEY